MLLLFEGILKFFVYIYDENQPTNQMNPKILDVVVHTCQHSRGRWQVWGLSELLSENLSKRKIKKIKRIQRQFHPQGLLYMYGPNHLWVLTGAAVQAG